MLPELDLEKLESYNRAFWECKILDRIAVAVSAPRARDNLKKIPGQMGRAAFEDPAEEIINRFKAVTENYFRSGLLLPVFFPNLGPAAFAAFYGTKWPFCSAAIRSTASWAAHCSASRRHNPLPVPMTMPLISTSTKNTRAWAGPLCRIIR